MARSERNHRQKAEEPSNVAVMEPLAPANIDEFLGPDDVEDEIEEPETAATPAQPAPPAALTVPRAAELPPDEFFAFCAQYPTPADLDMYVYRIWPKIHTIPPPGFPSGKKVPVYIEKLKGIVTPQTNRVADLEWLRMVRGSGKYQICLLARVPGRTRTHEICRTFVEINEYDMHPPIFNDWNELIPCEENKWFIERLLRDNVIIRTPEGKFVAFTQNQPAAPTNGAASPDIGALGALLDKTVGHAVKLSEAMTPKQAPKGDDSFMQIWLAQLATEREERRAERDREREERREERKAAEAARAKAEAEAATARAEAQKERDAARDRDMKFMEKMLDRAEKTNATPAPATADPIEMMGKTLKVLTDAKETLGIGEAAAAQSNMKGWQEFSQPIITEFMQMLRPFAQVGAALLGAKFSGQQQQQQAARPGPPATVQQQQPQPTAQPQPAPQQQQQPQQQPPEEPVQDPTMLVLNAAISYVDLTLRDHFMNDLSGSEFAAWFCDVAIPLPPPYNAIKESMLGVEALREIQKMSGSAPDGTAIPAPKFGKAIILAAYQSNQNVWNKLIPTQDKLPKFEKFLDEFLAYDTQGEK